jgi:RluA family pseudouridine synthase
VKRSKEFTSKKYTVVYETKEDHHGLRLDQFLKLHFQTFSREKIKKKIASGTINILNREQKFKASTKLLKGDQIEIVSMEEDFARETWNQKEIELDFDIETVYEDEDYIVINKPPFMSTHPTGGHLFYCATVILEERLKIPISSVHRLDRETSGLLVLSKNPKTSKLLTKVFENRKVKKVYFLIAKKNDQIDFPFVATQRLGSEEDFVPKLFVHCYDQKSSKGKSAETSFHKIASGKEFVLALASPKTGRQHQIRAHAAFHDIPLIGDKLYNGDPAIFTRHKDKVPLESDFTDMIIPRHALHAIGLKLPGPFNRVFVSNLPKDLTKVLINDIGIDMPQIIKLVQEKTHTILEA